ncbi:hypothetical protein SEA_HARAMBE_29 [Gordonia phage Harambe]|uniref:Uncharacterized protein n=12 Tax=Woesvirus woes TaxID=1982751 RepID=A0A482JGU3_9CAUD|nr:hypothetical protein SEA_ANAMIKA_29 [Gordonia phage Anamika]AVP43214.1 hypothetical protein PBI_HAIL2PITT_29 [Gordonia phage Hail2Pitt]QAX94313.1 hypothetical protein SEA_GUILLAUME_29 [Gordonia phage Guillaume]QAX94636.1 hypothetical protein SEA_HARAMBE_29 [Gordonia phage Harambe]QAX95298.1 hypothetical protein SEA_HELLO_29 [Gordonia phage Hello]QAX95390.1 hypothetical protein SEA_NEOEVIE_29 [Gordonia phage Neoevie]QBP30307.1 hypothetical protein SEA_JORMUNGANDR_29 [Gordonia phage Jormunga
MSDITFTHPEVNGVTFVLSADEGAHSKMLTLRGYSDDLKDEFDNPKLLLEVGFPNP